MTEQELSKAKNPDLRASLAAMRRAAAMARQTAIQTNTEIVVVREGKLVRITAEQLKVQQADGRSPPSGQWRAAAGSGAAGCCD